MLVTPAITFTFGLHKPVHSKYDRQPATFTDGGQAPFFH